MKRPSPLVIGAIALVGLSVLTVGGVTVALVTGSGGPPSQLALRLAAHHRISIALAQGIERTANRIQTRPEWLAAIMDLETGGTFDPAVRNPISKAVGLIQFTPETARRLGTNANALAELSALAQLRYVVDYFERVKSGQWPDDPRPFPLNTLQRTAFSVFWLPGRDAPLTTELPEYLKPGNYVDQIGEYLAFIRGRMLPGVS